MSTTQQKLANYLDAVKHNRTDITFLRWIKRHVRQLKSSAEKQQKENAANVALAAEIIKQAERALQNRSK